MFANGNGEHAAAQGQGVPGAALDRREPVVPIEAEAEMGLGGMMMERG